MPKFSSNASRDIRKKVFDYCSIRTVFIELKNDFSYDNLYCKISFDDEVMYENDFENLECQLFEL